MKLARQHLVSTVGPVLNQSQTTGRKRKSKAVNIELNVESSITLRKRKTKDANTVIVSKPKRAYNKKTSVQSSQPTEPVQVPSQPTEPLDDSDNRPLNMSSTCLRQSTPSQESIQKLDQQPTIINSDRELYSRSSPERIIHLQPLESNSNINLEQSEILQMISEARMRLIRIENSQKVTKPMMPKLPKINQFSGEGEEDFELFKEDIANLISRQAYTEEQKVQILQSYLTGNARYTFQGFSEYQKQSFQESIIRLGKIFACTTMHEWLEELEQLKHKSPEDYRVFGAKINRIVLNAYPVAEMTKMAVESLKVNHFLRGINSDLAEMIRRRQPKTLDVATEMAKVHEVNIPQLQGTLKRKITESKKPEQKHLLFLSTEEEINSSIEFQDTDSGETPVKNAKKNDGEKMTLNQVVHEVKNNNKQTGQKIGDVKKKVEDLESKWLATTEHLNLLQNNYQQAMTNQQHRPAYQYQPRPPYHQKSNQDFGKKVHFEKHFEKKKFECYYCRSPDHFKRDCPKLKESQGSQAFTHHHHHHDSTPNGESRNSSN